MASSYNSKSIGQLQEIAAVSCSLNAYRLGQVGLGSGMMGWLGHAWVGAWHGGSDALHKSNKNNTINTIDSSNLWV